MGDNDEKQNKTNDKQNLPPEPKKRKRKNQKIKGQAY